jgi:dipeptidyl-peptidase-4
MKWKSILIQLIIFIFSVINLKSQIKVEKIELYDAVASSLFVPNVVSGIRSMANGVHYSTLNENSIVQYSYKTGLVVDTLFSGEWLAFNIIGTISDYEFSSDESKILLTTNRQNIYRYSFTASYFVYDRKKKTLLPVSTNVNQQLATFSPDGNKVAFTRKNNLYIFDLESRQEVAVTTDGEFNKFINGAPDWVYEEEFSFSKAFEWSPDSKSIAFMRFDESKVKTFSMAVYDSLYPSIRTIKYPKAGEANSVVTVWVYSIGDRTIRQMDTGSETDMYIPRIKWTETYGKLCILRLNRLQNKIDVIIADMSTGNSSVVYTETNKYFISEISDDFIHFLPGGKFFMVFSERSGFNHLYLYDMSGRLQNPVTKGDFDVTGIEAIDFNNQILYYSSTEISPLDRDIYSIRFDGKDKKRLSCNDGTSEVSFSATFKYYILTNSNANKPPTYTLFNAQGKLIRVLEENKNVQSEMQRFGFQKREFIKVPTSKELELNAFIIKPADFDSAKRYPLFMRVYGGPQFQEVLNSWDNSAAWLQYLVQQGYIVACVDNRGTDGRGEEFRKCTYLQLGKYELEDQLNAARYFGSLPYIDPQRIAIFGWSYGGYLSSLCMVKGEGVFKLGIAVAPVTNWRYYDNIYTERFMRTPQENPQGYDDNSPINFTGKLQGKFLLVHGSADDNVHLQNTMVFAEKLIQSDKDFEQFIYPDKNHGIYGGNTRFYLYKKMTDFILKNL